jgi:threonine synthase
VPQDTPEAKLCELRKSGTNLILVDGNYDLAAELAVEESRASGRLLLAGDYLLRRVGQETCGEEIAMLPQKIEYIIVPVGNGTIFSAVADGFNGERKKTGVKLIGVQGAGANPVEIAWRTNNKIMKISDPKTVGVYFNVGNPGDGELVLDAVKKSSGLMVAVNDQEIIEAQQSLMNKYEIFVNRSAASSFAGYLKLSRQNFFGKKDQIVLILTGK